jgi:hypothetical protein
MIAALDPFHDHQLKNLAGWPDVQTGASVVRCVKQSMTIAAPTGTNTNWDCHIIQWPWLTPNTGGTAVGNLTPTSRNGQNYAIPAVGAQNLLCGGLQAYFTPAGSPLSIVGNGGTVLLGTLAVDPLFTQGVTRLIGGGFEVHNTTSQLNVQGSVITYRQMANENTKSTWVGGQSSPTVARCIHSSPLIRFPPQNTKEAMLLAGSRQWEAKDGLYTVLAFHTTENPATDIVPVTPIIGAAATNNNEGVINTSAINVFIPGAPDANGNCAVPSFRIFNIHQSGCIFSGLSAGTSLTINQNLFLESFPGPAEIDLLPLGTPSAQFDPDALDLYSRISTSLPVGVPVSENGLGDWFYDAAITAAKYIGPVLTKLPHPALQAAGMLANGIANAADKPKKQKQPKPQPKTLALAPPNSWGPPPHARPPKKKKVANRSRSAPDSDRGRSVVRRRRGG